MNEDFCFEIPPYEAALTALGPGESFSAARLLALIDGLSQTEAEDAFQLAEDLELRLLMDLPRETEPASPRLAWEDSQVRAGTLRRELGENDPLALYLREIDGPTLSAGAIQALAERCLEGDERAMEALARGYLPRAAELAMSMTGRGVLLLDLIQEGSLGLWQSVMRYAGGDFSAFADRWIRFALAKAVILQAHAQGVGRELKKAMEAYQAADRALLARLGRNPLPEELSQELGWDIEEIRRLEKLISDAQSAQRSAPEPEEPAQNVEHTAYFQSRRRVEELLEGADPEDVRLLSLRFGLETGKPATAEETAQMLDISPEEVLRREAEALKRLRED